MFIVQQSGIEYKIGESEENWAEIQLERPELTYTTHLHELVPDMYHRDVNGRYVPLISRIEYTNRNRQIYTLTFPRMQCNFTVKTLHNMKWYYNPVGVGEKVGAKYGGLGARKILIIEAIRRGVPLHNAIKLGFANAAESSLGKIANRLMMNKRFVDQIFEDVNYMANLKAELEGLGIGNLTVATHIKSILDEPNSNPTLLKYALETVRITCERDSATQPRSLVAEATQPPSVMRLAVGSALQSNPDA